MSNVLDLCKNYPRSLARFLEYFLLTYQLRKRDLIYSPLMEQYKVLCEFLGYPTEFPVTWSLEQIEEKVTEYLYIYESSLLSYPYGVPDLLEIIKSMDFQEIQDKYPQLHERRSVAYSLSMAVVSRVKEYQITDIPLLSLQNAVTNHVVTVDPKIQEDEILNQLVKNPLRYEDVPF